jgi:hypothetical protein
MTKGHRNNFGSDRYTHYLNLGSFHRYTQVRIYQIVHYNNVQPGDGDMAYLVEHVLTMCKDQGSILNNNNKKKVQLIVCQFLLNKAVKN